MTKQEILTKVKNHLLKQGEKSTMVDLNAIVCAYRGTEGKKCAIGCLISDKDYRPDFEGVDVTSLKRIIHKIVPEDTQDGEDPLEFLSRLQRIHDNTTPDIWARELLFFSTTYNLNFYE